MSQIRERWPPQGIAARQITSGTLANRPAFGSADSYYWATDEYILYRDTGAAWEVVSGQPYARMLIDVFGFGTGSGTLTTGNCYLTPLQIPFTVTVDIIGIIVATQAGNVRVGIYNDAGDDPATGALIVESASTAVGVANSKQEISIANTQLTPGLYWLALQNDNATVSLLGVWGDSAINLAKLTGGTLVGRRFAQVYGAFTDPCSATTADVRVPSMYVRLASVP